MNKFRVRAHTCYLGRTGYNAHARGFFRELSKHVDLRVRNFTWDNNPDYLDEVDLSILDKITLNNGDGTHSDFNIAEQPHFQKYTFTTPKGEFRPLVDIVLVDMNHHYFYEKYDSKIKIAYTVWESTRLPGYFLDQLIKNFDYVWVVTEWHKKVLTEQGYPAARIHVVNEAVDAVFLPAEFDPHFEEHSDGRFKFNIFGRWDFRKSVPEIIDAFLKEFDAEESVDLVMSVDNPFSVDGMNSTEERLRTYGFIDDRLKVKHFVNRGDYIKYMQNGHVLLTCARSEGWNIPLIEAMACGTPALYSDYGAQLEFAAGHGVPVDTKELVPCLSGDTYNVQANAGTEVPGYYAAPDYDDLRKKMRLVYENYATYKRAAVKKSIEIREKFTWENAAKQAMEFFAKAIADNNESEWIISLSAINRMIVGEGSLDWTVTMDYVTGGEVLSLRSQDNVKGLRICCGGGYHETDVQEEWKHFLLPIETKEEDFTIEFPIFENVTKVYRNANRGPSKFYDSRVLHRLTMGSFFRKDSSDRKIEFNCIDGPFVEIKDSFKGKYSVEFIDEKDSQIVHSAVITENCWTRANRAWYTDWKILVKDLYADKIIYDQRIDLKGQRVFICFESSSLGDTIAWIPYVEEFRKKHGCKVLVSTFHNHLFSFVYPGLEFLERGVVAENIFASYRIGWFYEGNSQEYNPMKNPRNFRDQPMQKTAADILGLEYKQIRPRITLPNTSRTIQEKYVCIGIHATTQAKYWNREKGWQEVVDYLKSVGYQVVLISKESGTYMGNTPPSGIIDKTGTQHPLIDRINDLQHAEFYIGLGSGLSWLAWAVGTPTVLISGFSTPETEFHGDDVVRVFNESSCNGCFSRHRLDAGDWEWCPDHKGSTRQFECSRSITSQSVIESMKKFLS